MSEEKEGTDVINYFDSAGQQLSEVAENPGAVAVMARSEAEIKMKAYLAHVHPRNEGQAYESIIRSMDRPSMAEKATYNYPRGGTEIKGPSVYLAREMARLWGNIISETQIISITEDEVHIRAVAFDLQTNATSAKEDRFKKLIYRKKGGWVKPDDRDLRELINKHAAICERNAILQIIPSDTVEDATDRAETTCRDAASGKLKTERTTYIKLIIRSFIGVGVTVEMLEIKLGHEMKHVTEEEIADLRGIINSLRDGNSKISDHFKPRHTREEGDFDMEKISGEEQPLPHRKKGEEKPELGGEATCKHGVPASETCEKCQAEFGDKEDSKEKAAKIAQVKQGVGIVGDDVFVAIMGTLELDPETPLRELDIETLSNIHSAINIAADNQD